MDTSKTGNLRLYCLNIFYIGPCYDVQSFQIKLLTLTLLLIKYHCYGRVYGSDTQVRNTTYIVI
jgi:hypothetical protein